MANSNTQTTTFIKQEPGLPVRIKQEPGLLQVNSNSFNIRVANTERLSSFTLPRDLTLGGPGQARPNRSTSNPNRKVYTPNLNAVRNKNGEVKTSRDTTRGSPRGRGDRGRLDRGGRGARGGSRNTTLIQTTGLFSEGAAENVMKRLSGIHRDSDSRDSVGSIRRPTISKREIKVDPVDEQQRMTDLLGDLDNDTEEKYLTNDGFMPVQLLEMKSDIKMETDTTNRIDTSNVCYPHTLNDFFMKQQPQLFLLQLPDTLPGEGREHDSGTSTSQLNSDLDGRASTPNLDDSFCTVNHINEGQIGKIIRYRSGRTKMVLGETQFNIDLGMDPGLLQEAITVKTNANERSATFINLGSIQAKLSATPDWENMFKDNR